MTHFSAIVLVPQDLAKKGLFRNPGKLLSKRVMDLLYPHAAYFPGTEYKVPCYCVPSDVLEASIEQANNKVGEFWQLYRDYVRLPEDTRPDWSDYEPFRQWEKVAVEAAKSHPGFEERKPDCSTCNGTGIMNAQENFSGWEFDYFNVAEVDPEVELSNAVPTGDLIHDIDFQAIVTPDWKWHKVEYGFGDDDPNMEWRARAKKILLQFPDHLGVKVHMSE